jgi:hypothetical protein
VSVSSRPRDDRLARRKRVVFEVVQPGEMITTLCASVAKLGRSIAALRSLASRGSCFVTQRRHEVTILGRPLARTDAPVVGESVSAGREVVVGRVLIFIRAHLIAFARRLIVVRPRLIVVRRRLIETGQTLITLARRVNDVSVRGRRDAVTRKLGTAPCAHERTRRFATHSTRCRQCDFPASVPGICPAMKRLRYRSYAFSRA